MKIVFPRDADLFMLLWTHKILTTKAIWLGAFHQTSLKTCYERLLKLKKSSYIRRIPISDSGYAWSLSINGFQILKDQLPELKVPGYGSESPLHDLFIPLAAYSQHWPLLPTGISFLTEEEIKRFPLEYLPSWYPMDLIRRPDGIWQIQSQSKYYLVAIEIETTLKSALKYETIARQYQDSESIDRVVWFVPTLNFAETILSSFIKRVGSSNFKHDFILLSDLISHGWESNVIVGGDNGNKLTKILNSPLGTASMPGRRLSHLDISLSPHKSVTSKFLSEAAPPDLATYFKSTPFSTFLKFR